jgi:hypothetical protein
MAIIKKIGTSHFICKVPRVSEGHASRACLKARSHPLHETLGKVPDATIAIKPWQGLISLQYCTLGNRGITSFFQLILKIQRRQRYFCIDISEPLRPPKADFVSLINPVSEKRTRACAQSECPGESSRNHHRELGGAPGERQNSGTFGES